MSRSLVPVFLLVLASTAGSARAASFQVPNSDCLVGVCHGAGAVFPRLNMAARFDFDATANNDTVLSQHNISYAQDGNFATIDTPNGCKGCHQADLANPNAHRYVATQTILAHPAGGLIPRSTDFSAYQAFCLACHDAGAASVPLPAALPSSGQQVAPSSRTNPAAQQSAPPWVVPAVPPKDVNAGGSFTNPAPFFEYYEANGHGRAQSMNDDPMDVTCIAGGDGQGCHSAHGSTNRYLIDDSFGTAIDTAGEFVNTVCYGCHIQADLGDEDLLSSGRPENIFHTMRGDGLPMHDKGTGMAQWIAGIYFMDIATPFGDPNGAGTPPNAYTATGILPFWAGAGAPIQSRVYGPTLGTHWVMCVSCHDVHGTSPNYWRSQQHADDTGPQNTRGMLRKFPVTWDYLDPLCWECHSR